MRQSFLLFILLLFVGRAHAEFKPPSDKKMDALLKKAQEIKVLKPDSALIYAQEVVAWAKKKNEVHTLIHSTLVVADIYYYLNSSNKCNL